MYIWLLNDDDDDDDDDGDDEEEEGEEGSDGDDDDDDDDDDVIFVYVVEWKVILWFYFTTLNTFPTVIQALLLSLIKQDMLMWYFSVFAK